MSENSNLNKPLSIALWTNGHFGLQLECITKNYFSYFSTMTYVVGTQKNCLNETHNIC